MSGDLLTHELRGAGGETVLLLNGGMMTHASWAPVAAGLENAYRVLGCDFRGQLRSPGEGHARFEAHVADVVALLEALELDAVHVLGTSFGGEVGLLLAARHPARVETLAVVAAVDRSPPGMGESSRELAALARGVIDGGGPDAFQEMVLADVYSPAYRDAHADVVAAWRQRTAALPRSWYRGLLGFLRAIEDFDLTPDLGRIVCPALVVHAAHDAVMPAARVEALAAAVPGAELRVHPASGHALVVEDPEWLVGVYREFLARRRRGLRR